ncbi:MAG: CBS domain-containing protein [Variibacter sp.]|nr:CBS domain-containing protein [Variibacter sp.]
MNAADVMVTDVVTVSPDATVQEVAKLLLAKRISGVPVVDAEGRLVGLVSEGDLIRRPESGTSRRHPWWLAMLAGRDALAAEYIKEHGSKVADVMTRKVISIAPETSLNEVANLLERNAIKRVPVVKDGKVVGIVSRANLLQALAGLGDRIEPANADDAAIRENIVARLRAEPWSQPSLINVIVREGLVELWGIVDTSTEKQAVRVVAESTPGVRSVNDNLIIRPAHTGA